MISLLGRGTHFGAAGPGGAALEAEDKVAVAVAGAGFGVGCGIYSFVKG
jgi:hypothetical protein